MSDRPKLSPEDAAYFTGTMDAVMAFGKALASQLAAFEEGGHDISACKVVARGFQELLDHASHHINEAFAIRRLPQDYAIHPTLTYIPADERGKVEDMH